MIRFFFFFFLLLQVRNQDGAAPGVLLEGVWNSFSRLLSYIIVLPKCDKLLEGGGKINLRRSLYSTGFSS